MTRLTWGGVGSREYETGIDRGVLFVGNDPGVAWNSITEVEHSPSGGDARPFYIDGVKYLNEPALEEFEATLSAFYSPPEFDVCDGTKSFPRGLFATQQRRKSFGLSYRTKIGNDVDGINYGYKIHLVYNALAQPSQRKYTTLGKDPSADPLSWSLTSRKLPMPGTQRVAHLIISTLEAPERLIQQLEDIIYGTDTTISRLPSPTELYNMFTTTTDLTVTYIEDGSLFESDGSAVILLTGGLTGTVTIEHEDVIDNGDGTFTMPAFDNLEVLDLVPPGERQIQGSAVTTLTGGEFALEFELVVDNGDGSYTIL